jgi:competence protein ComEC
VLLVRHEGHRILLTGDLTGAGLRRVLALPLEPIDVMLAPHHGSPRANTLELAAWAQPRWVVSCQGPAGESTASHPYDSVGAEYLTTSAQGAVTVRSHAEYLLVETFR